MIEKIKASTSEKVIFVFILVLGLFTLASFLLLKDKCLFVKNYDPQKIDFLRFYQSGSSAQKHVQCCKSACEAWFRYKFDFLRLCQLFFKLL